MCCYPLSQMSVSALCMCVQCSDVPMTQAMTSTILTLPLEANLHAQSFWQTLCAAYGARPCKRLFLFCSCALTCRHVSLTLANTAVEMISPMHAPVSVPPFVHAATLTVSTARCVTCGHAYTAPARATSTPCSMCCASVTSGRDMR